MQHQSTFSKSARSSLYNTSNRQYGTRVGPQSFDIKKSTVPTYTQIVNSMNDFKKVQRLIKSKGISVDNPMRKTTEFPLKQPTYKYPQKGLNVGPSVYDTTAMNYGQTLPQKDQLPNKYFPVSSSFTKTFNGGNYKFNGLNTVKTVSGVHQKLNDI